MGFGGGLSTGGFTWNMDGWQETLDKIPLMLEENTKKTQSEVDRAYEEKLALFDQLDSSRKENPSSYQSSFNSLAAGGKKDYLWHLYDTGELSKKEYKDQVHIAYEQEFVKNAQQGIYTGYVPFEVEGETLFVEARQFDPEVSDTFKSTDWFIKKSIKPYDTFYFPEQHAKQPELTEKDWLVGMADDSGYIQYVDDFKYNPNKQGGYDSTVEGRAKNILDPDKGFAGTIAPLVSIAGTITGNPLLVAAGTLAAGGDIEDVVKSYAIGQVTAPILENTVANLGIDKDLLGMDAEAFSESTMDVQTAILEGKDIEEALLKEFGVDAVKQLGSALPDIDIDLPESKLLSTIGDALEPVVDAVRAGGRAIDDAVLQPIKTGLEPVVDVAQQGIDVLQQAGRDFDDKFLEPWTEPTGEFLSDAEDKIKDLGRAIDDAVDFGAVAEGMLGGGQGQQQQQQRTASTPTEGLFDKELFKFDTEIKSTQEMLSPMMNLRKYG